MGLVIISHPTPTPCPFPPASSSIRFRRPVHISNASPPSRFPLRLAVSNCLNVEFNHVATIDEDEDASSSSPILHHLNSNILGSNQPIGLATYIDNFTLSNLPVLTHEEQALLASTPAHPAALYGSVGGMSVSVIGHQHKALTDVLPCFVGPYCINLGALQPELYACFNSCCSFWLYWISGHLLMRQGLMGALYASCFAGNLVEQLWNFAWPAAVALLHPSLLPVAVVGFFTKLAIFVGGPLVGRLMDHFPRVLAYNCLSCVQAAAQLLSVAVIICAHSVPVATSPVLLQPWFIALVLAGAIERLSGLALGVAMERDWVVLLAGANRPIALAEANAVISRIDLLCEIAGASFFGILLSKYDPVTCLKLAAALMIVTIPVVILLMWLSNTLSSGVLDRFKSPQAFDKIFNGDMPEAGNLVEIGLDAIKHGWLEYKQQPVLPASLAYVFLYFNVVLTPGGLMTAFLTQRGLNPSIIGIFSGLCAFMGVAATFISASLVKRIGILKAGAAGLVFQASLLILAVAVYWSGSLTQEMPLLFFLCLIVLSRLGHMSYDVVGAQILQTGIPASKANLIGTTEVSVASLAEFMMLGVAIIANDVSHFGFLAMLSLWSVVGAAWMYCRWLLNPTDEQRRLFSFDPQF